MSRRVFASMVLQGSLSTNDTLIIGSTGELLDVTLKVKNAIIGGVVKGETSSRKQDHARNIEAKAVLP